MTTQEGVLTWPYVPACDLAAEYPDLTEQQRDAAVAAAVEWVWSRSGRQFGTRAVLLRPQSVTRGGRLGLPGVGLQAIGPPLLGYPFGPASGCGPEQHQVLELDGPVVSIEEVRIDGATVDEGVWRQEGNYLVRQDGGDWPATQNMIAPLGAAGTWSVSYTRGVPVTAFGQFATGKLVCYFAKQAAAGHPCALPANTSRVTRAGVSIERDTGKGKAAQTSPVPEVDQWISTVNPNGLAGAPRVWSPDIQRHRLYPFAGSYLAADRALVPVGQPVSASFLLLEPDDPVPAGTPIGTVILRTQPEEGAQTV